MDKKLTGGMNRFLTKNMSRRNFITGAIATGTLVLTACDSQQSVQITTTATPSPSPTASVAPTAPLPKLPPLAPKTYPATLAGATAASDELVNHFAKTLDSPATLIHAVRALGRNFTRADGSNAVEYLCGHHAEEVTVNGQKLAHFIRVSEFHDNSFLKTFIEAGVPAEQSININGTKYTLKDVGEHAKSLFTLDANNLRKFNKTPPARNQNAPSDGAEIANYLHEHLPWGLIAFAQLMPGGAGTWTNIYGEKIVLVDVIDKALTDFEGVCQTLRPAMEKNEDVSLDFHIKVNDFSCFGGHAAYAFLACLKNGYTDKNLKARILSMLDTSIYRLAKESASIEKQYADAAKGPISPNPQEDAMIMKGLERAGITKAELIDMVTTRALIKLTGHLLEAVNYARLHNLFQPTPQQTKLIQEGEQKLFASIVKMRAFNVEGLKNFDPKQFGDVIIGLGHASRAMKLRSAANPDKNPKAI